ncbi:MAG TPA: peptide ABC transporter substrate-binding protein [Thermomicrobiales bacterium]|nr:peptide ABC transporter substrate-binding protein [Thermomicrobiales bacterium]
MTMSSSPLGRLYDSLKAGKVSRREFLERGSALGIGAGAALFLANSATAGPGRNGFAFYPGQDGTPAASPSGAAVTLPDAGMEGKTRGQDGELRLIQWQAPTMAAIHSSVGTKDFLAGQLVSEPLLLYLPDGTIAPVLAAEVPSVENGLLAEDLSSVTFKLKEGVTWSDGEPFTAKDVVFTWQWVTNPSNASVNAEIWSVIESVEAQDDLTAVVTFTQPSAAWFEPFTGWTAGPIYPSHVFGDDPNNKNDAFLTAPVGTGPYVVESFSVNDQVTYIANENYREANKPAFSRVVLKGGGEAAAAARAVCQTGEYDYAWNLQVEPDVLTQIDEEGQNGEVVVEKGTSVERIHINFSDPNKEVNGQRSEMNTPHPFLTDDAVRQAMNVAVPRDVIATQFYGEGQPATANILTGLESFESPNTSWEYNLEKAAQILDDAGWALDGDVRAKDGVKLNVVYATSVNSVRQKTQAVIKQAWESIGIKVQLEQIDSGIYFDSGAGNEQNISHFYWDIDMYTNNPSSPIPMSFVVSWYAGPNGENIAQKENSWQGQNYNRWANADYDAKFEELQKTTDFEAASALLIELNDMLIENVVVIPEVNRSVDTYAVSTRLRKENCVLGPLNDLVYWNIVNWNLADGQEPR